MMQAMPVEELAASLGCSRLEAWAEIRQCATALAPYLHSRAPIAVNLTDHKRYTLVIVDDAEMLENQVVDGEMIAEVSQGEVSQTGEVVDVAGK
jgi:hypothetical protein